MLPSDVIKALPFEKQVDLFFNAGFNLKQLQSNFEALTELAAQLPQTLRLSADKVRIVHVLLPCYFQDCQSFTEQGILTLEKLHIFLQKAALFYQRLYQACKHKLDVVLFIPPLSYFEKAITGNLQESQEQAIGQLLMAELMPLVIGNNLPVMLINQNEEQLAALMKILRAAGIDPYAIGSAVLSVRGCHHTTIFNTYTLKRETTYDYKTSPVILSSLLPLLRRGNP